MGRDEKYHKRDRHIYALIFDNGCCYIGQSVDIKKRELAHRSKRGGWGSLNFKVVHLATYHTTKFECENWEWAWRLSAQRQGWKIYGKPHVLVNSYKRSTAKHRAMSYKCHFNKNKTKKKHVVVFVLFLLTLFLLYPSLFYNLIELLKG